MRVYFNNGDGLRELAADDSIQAQVITIAKEDADSREDYETALLRIHNDSFGQGVRRAAIGRGGVPDEVALADRLVDHRDACDLRGSIGQRPGLVESDRIDLGQHLQVEPSFDEDAQPGRA